MPQECMKQFGSCQCDSCLGKVTDNNMPQNWEDCEHDFRYSHIEYPQAGTYSHIPPNKEVVVCRKCGEIRKFNQINL